ncbi:MAG: glycosyltransferase [Candidatus Peribacteraceae bacterium]|nr:glycosyltransferase [Candidatus Peribacteraceae bacterium]
MVVRCSIIIPCYNDGRYLPDAVTSAERCSAHDECEIIVSDDGSTDAATQEVLRQLEQARRCTVLRNPHVNAPTARNAGITRARGEYILPLDADNTVFPGYIAKAMAILDVHPKVGVVYADARRFGEEERQWHMGSFDPQRLVLRNFIDMCSVFRKVVWEQCGGFNTSLTALDDWDFWLTAYERGWQFHYLKEPFFGYRIRSDSLIHTFCSDPQKMKREHLHVWEKHFGLFLIALDANLRRNESVGRRLLRRVRALFQW